MGEYGTVGVGDKLILAGSMWSQNKYVGKVGRLTKTQIITTAGERFNRSSGESVGSSDGYILKVATQKDIGRIIIRSKVLHKMSELVGLVTGTDKALIENIDKVIEVAVALKTLVEIQTR